MHIHIIGDPSHELAPVAARLATVGIDARINGDPVPGARVLVVISCREGLTESGFVEFTKWNGIEIDVLGIALTLVDDDVPDDLRELVHVEACQFLMRDVPRDDEPRSLMADAPWFAQQVHGLAQRAFTPMQLSANGPAFERYAPRPKSAKKPWWKFW
jgi:hypothetical protein